MTITTPKDQLQALIIPYARAHAAALVEVERIERAIESAKRRRAKAHPDDTKRQNHIHRDLNYLAECLDAAKVHAATCEARCDLLHKNIKDY